MAIVEEPSKARLLRNVAIFLSVTGLINLALWGLVIGPGLHLQKVRSDEPKTADEAMKKAMQYYSSGWIERSRAACTKAVELAGSGSPMALRAERFRKARLPRYAVSKDAERLNIEAYNHMAFGRSEPAKKLWLQCIDKYPQFEWSYSNLASMCADDHDDAAAIKYWEAALAINPDYVHALTGLAQAKMRQREYGSARQLLDRALQLAPEDGTAQQLSRLLEKRRG